MAKESTIRKKATDKLLDEGWVVWVPTRSRFGSSNTYWIEDGEKQRKGTDDFFTMFDLACWKDNRLKLVQYTTRSHVSERINKITDYLKRNELKLPEGVEVECWGYTDRVGFDRIEMLDNEILN